MAIFGREKLIQLLVRNDSEVALAASHDLEKYDTLKLAMPEPIRTLTGSQASGMLSGARDLLPAGSKLLVSLEGSVNASDKLFDGIIDWFAAQNGDTGGYANVVSDWQKSIPIDLDIYDVTAGSASPSSSPLASLTETAHGSLNWFASKTKRNTEMKKDLAIHTSLNIAGQNLRNGGAGAAATPTLEAAVFPVWVGKNKTIRTPTSIRFSAEDTPEREVLRAVDKGNGGYLQTHFEDQLLEANAGLEGFPSAGMEPAVLTHMLGEDLGHVWTYDRSEVGGDGYFVVAKSTSQIRAGVHGSLSVLDAGHDFSDEQINSILTEFGKRGIDSLQAAVAGGVKATGALGEVIASKILQPLSEGVTGILTDAQIENDNLTVVVPLNSFDKKLRGIARSLDAGGSVPRPDLLAISVLQVKGGMPVRVKLTPIEAKCYKGLMDSCKTLGTARSAVSRVWRLFEAPFCPGS